MASTPTTKSQVQAYRFVLQRMQSALVRRDAVMLHDPMRNHSRATAVGVVLGVVGLLGFLIVGLFSPAPKLDNETQIAISKETGQVYVVDNAPRRLIPMTNLASARLLWYSRNSPDAQQGQGGGDAPAGTAGGQQGAAGGTPKLVSEKALANLPRGRLTGLPDAPDVLPKANLRIDAQWSVCDTLDLDEFRENQAAENQIKTSVIAGVSGGNPELGDEAILVQQRTGAKKAYLIYKKPKDLGNISSSTVRAEVDLKNDKVMNALRLKGKQPRAISTAMLNAIPEVAPLIAPVIADQGKKATYVTETNVNIGEVVEVNLTGTATYMVALKDGFQEVDQTVGDLLRWSYSNNEKSIPLTPNAVVNHRDPKSPLKLDSYPERIPTTLEANPGNTVLCLGWKADNYTEDTKAEHTSVTIGAKLPGPKEMTPVELNATGATGEILDEFLMLPGKAAVVRASQGKGDFGTGPVQIVTGRGVRYGVPDAATAAALGLDGTFAPAPNQILSLLPMGPQLNKNEANRSYDSIPVPKGTIKDPQAVQK
ncbi:type VII secretion protein EccB [Lentzea albidocapillata subsp. violacea]|uniref:Type VII secretion protein EccB n=1 Tax=Lentzea albidocapillata subsp. violacea TaxID=128104 RepID=A0A1G8VXP3_9PSEU|nr:type VII secretion protein EccB [Lentzea albidocapillata]SDJ70858.1 type VII secretion protein EccB [Lentzea albidocapillata subsp. violacea]